MKTLRNLLLICFGVLILLLLVILVAYFIKFSGGISDRTDNWILFISICNLGSISILTGLNVWVFYKLTSLIALENKMSRSENAILELRISDFKQLRQYATNLKIAIIRNRDYQNELDDFWKILLSMQASSLFSTTEIKQSTLDPILDYLKDALLNKNKTEELLEHIDRSLRTIEILMFSNQLRDDRLLEEIRKHPNRFDSTLVSTDNFANKVLDSYNHNQF